MTKEKDKISKIINVAAENQSMHNYLHHLEYHNKKLEINIDRIKSSLFVNCWETIKSYLNKFNLFFLNIFLTKEFLEWDKNKKDGSTDIIIFAGIKFNFRFQRPQQLAKELVKKGHRVFYVENDFIYYADKNDKLTPEIKKVEQNLYTVKLATHSKFTKRKFVYYGEISKEDRLDLIESINNFFGKMYVSKAIFKVDNPFWGIILNELKFPIIYDCIDDHEVIESNPDNIKFEERNIVRISQAIISVSVTLAKKIRNKYKHSYVTVIGNAGEYTHFAKESMNNLTTSQDIRLLDKPILGYCGAISDWFDINVLELVAKSFPKCSIVLLGDSDNAKVKELSLKYKNIHLLGEKKYNVLPNYYKEFSICLIPFIKSHDVSKTLNPVKVYEYLATGKPIVSTYIPDLKRFGDSIYLSNNADEFCKNINKALSEKEDNISFKRIQFAKENTWEKRAEELENVINDILGRKL